MNNRIRSVGHVVRRPYSDSEESDNDVWYAEVDDSALGQLIYVVRVVHSWTILSGSCRPMSGLET